MTEDFSQQLIALLPQLRRYALSLSRKSDLADDLVQITAERAFAAQAQRNPDTRLEPWLFRILRNAWLDMARRRQTRGTEVEISDAPEAATVDGRQVVETRLMIGAAQAAMNDLPPDQRDVMLLICVEELTYAEAALVLEVPIGTVMSRLARARSAVVAALGIK